MFSLQRVCARAHGSIQIKKNEEKKLDYERNKKKTNKWTNEKLYEIYV